MVSGYHAFTKRDNGKLGVIIDCGLTGAVLVIAIWYLCVPLVWEAVTSGRETIGSWWLSWYPIALVAVAAAIGGACGYYLHVRLRGWFSTIGRLVFLVGLIFIGVVIGRRVQTIQRFRENQAAYLNRCAGYIRAAKQQQQELLSSLSADEQALSLLLETPEIAPRIEAPIAALRDRLDAELETLNNLRFSGREKAAEIESARAYELRAEGISSDAYIESLAKQKTGPELLGSQNGLDPLLKAEAVGLGAKIVEMGMAQGW
jgi:hypothetical protein